MCLISLAIDTHPRFPLVVAANRDEFLDRPAAALDWWASEAAAEPLLGGRDLRAGGTWMAVGANARLALLTNVRDLPRLKLVAPSRGAIVPAWLKRAQSAGAFFSEISTCGHNPFNLLAADFADRSHGRWWWADDQTALPVELGAGVHGVSNAALSTPWPKVQRLNQALRDAVAAAAAEQQTGAQFEASLFAALADRAIVPDDALPDTGVGIERERWLAPAFIRSPDGRYGTRCSTLLIVERHAERCTARLVERRFDDCGAVAGQRGVRNMPWPLRDAAAAPVREESISPV